MVAGRKRRKKRGVMRKAALWLIVGGLAVVVGFLAGYLWRDLRDGTVPGSDPGFAAVEALLGPLDRSEVRVGVRDREEAEELVARLEALAGDGVRLGRKGWDADRVEVALRVGERTHNLELVWQDPSATAPLLAIVIDDLGRSVEEARAFLDLDVKVIPSVLPHLPKSREVALLARDRGREYLLHLPMEPQGYPEVDPGEGAILVAMGRDEVRRLVRQGLADVPGAAGINNHMGSRLTEVEASLRWVMEELRGQNLYFLDSLTSARSVAAEAAHAAGLRWARRDVFLDNVQEDSAIAAQLEKALNLAKRSGRAVAIGHPHAATLRVLKAWSARLHGSGVRVVALSEIASTGDGV